MKKVAYYLFEHLSEPDGLGGEIIYNEPLYEVQSYAGDLCCIDKVPFDEALRIIKNRSYEIVK